MKKIILLCLALVLVMSLVGCGKKDIDEGADTFNAIEPANWGITLSAKNITPTGITIEVSQSGGVPIGELRFESYYTLQVWENDTWKSVPYIVDEDSVCWASIAYILPMGGSNQQEIKWGNLYGELPGGRYLLTKAIQYSHGSGDNDTATFTVEFEIE